ncbi:hypothetical protein GGX14DRAFT_343833, partial [Mycena pura]
MIIHENLVENASSHAGTDAVVYNVILQDDFNREDLRNFKSKRENDRLDNFLAVPPGEPPNGWHRGAVKIKLPCVGHCTPESEAFEIEIKDIYYRPLLDTLKEALQSPAFKHFHLIPF